MKKGRKIFVQIKKEILINGKVWRKRRLNEFGSIRHQFAKTQFINSQSIRWLEPLTILLLFGLLLVLVWLILS